MRQYGFEKQENVNLPGFTVGYYYEKEGLWIAGVEEEIYRELSNRMLETDFSADKIFDYAEYMKTLDCHYLLLFWKEQEEDRICFFSDTRRLRALEFLDFVMPESGLVKGDAQAACGRISSAILKVEMSELEIQDTLEYLMNKAAGYFEECEYIEAADYGRTHEGDIPFMKQYVKKKIPWAFVETMKLAEKGEEICIRSLENESGVVVKADPDIYIMIGCRGEVYDMKREKFERTYDASEEALDVFEQMLDFLPEAQIMSTGEYISLDESANLCYPKAGAGIYAKELQRRTKIFPVGNNTDYYLGRPGDYMAIRPEDFSDIYVIKRQIFQQTYEEKTE